jgi:hypothetical protein
MNYESTWWTVELPSGWQGSADGTCSTFTDTPEHGVLQISAANKDSGVVTDDDLKEFASERVASNIPLDPAVAGAFSGFTARYQKERQWWQEWWLRSGQLMIYVTYNISLGRERAEQRAVTSILSSLKAKVN